MKVKCGLEVMEMHEDDIAAVKGPCMGLPLDGRVERFRWRYPDRCPLMDVLCSLDWTYERLTAGLDSEMKGTRVA